MRQLLILAVAAAIAGAVSADNVLPKPETPSTPPALPAMPKGDPPQQREIEKMNGDYVAAFKKGDDKALAAFYTEDAEQMDANGNVLLAGRAAIGKCLQDYFRENKGAQIELSLDSVKSIAPDVVLEKGASVVTRADGKTERDNYVAIDVKRGGQWKIAQLTETVSAVESTPYSHLQELEWLVGSWKDNSPDAEVYTTCQWATNKAFLTRSFSARIKDQPELEGTEIIGWDPIKGMIKAWTFDSEGGVSEGTWTPDGPRWLIQTVTTLADGRKAAAHHTITRLSDDKYTWESNNRTFDGEVRPNIDQIEIDRVKSKQ